MRLGILQRPTRTDAEGDSVPPEGSGDRADTRPRRVEHEPLGTFSRRRRRMDVGVADDHGKPLDSRAGAWAPGRHDGGRGVRRQTAHGVTSSVDRDTGTMDVRDAAVRRDDHTGSRAVRTALAADRHQANPGRERCGQRRAPVGRSVNELARAERGRVGTNRDGNRDLPRGYGPGGRGRRHSVVGTARRIRRGTA